MTEPTQSELNAVGALSSLLDRVEEGEQSRAGSGGPPHRLNAWLALRLLVGAIPPDRRLQAIGQVMEFAVPDVMSEATFVAAVEGWSAPNADAFLTRITELAVSRARTEFAAEPERLADFHRRLAVTGEVDLLVAEDGQASSEGQQ